MRTLIKNGTVITATDQYKGDVLVEDEKIAVIGTRLDIHADTVIDAGSIFKALLRSGKNGSTICMHAENGGVIDVLVQRALAEGKTAPKYHALTRPARAEAEATHRAIALSEIADVPIYIVHLSAA